MPTHFDALEPRQLLASFDTFTDIDGDVFTLEVVGAGQATLSSSPDGNQIEVSATDAKSILRVRVTNPAGNGRVNLDSLTSDGPLRSADLSEANLVSDGSITLASVGQFRIGDVTFASVTINDDVEVPGAKSAFFGVVDGSTINFAARQREARFVSFSGQAQFQRGADRITCEGDWGGALASTFLSSLSFNTITIGGDARFSGIVNGSVNSLIAASFNIEAYDTFWDVRGRLGVLRCAGANNMDFKAFHYGTVTAGSFTGTLLAQSSDAAGFSFRSIRIFGAMIDGTIGVIENGVPGAIGSFISTGVADSTINAASIRTMRVSGDLFGVMNLSGATAGLTLGSLTVIGRLGAQLTIEGDMGPIRIGTVIAASDSSISDGPGQHSIRSITVTGGLEDTSFNLSVGSVGTITIGNGLFDSEFNLSAADRQPLKSLKVKNAIQGLTLSTNQSQGIGAISAAAIRFSNFNTGFISSITAGVGPLGGLRNSSLSLFGADPKGFALRTAKLGEGLSAATILADSDSSGIIGSISGLIMQDSSVLVASRMNSLLFTGDAGGIALSDALIRATDNNVGAFALGKLDFRGTVTNSTINSASSIDRFSARTIAVGTFVGAGRLAPFSALADVAGTMTPGNRINRITITDKDFALNGTAAFNAPAIGSITLNGPINTSGQFDGGQPFGFAAVTFGTVTLKNNAGQTVKPTIPTTAGNFNPFSPASAGNFIIRVLA